MNASSPKSDTDLNTILHPPDYRPGWLHIALVGSELLGRISPLALTPAWFALAAIACWPWGDLRIPIAVLSLALTVIDGSSLALLPRLERSFGPVTPPLLALTLVRTTLTFAVGLLWTNWGAFVATAGVQIALTAAAIYATWIEPFRIQVTHAELRSPKLHGHDPLRLLQISDLHIERLTRREHELLNRVEELSPDVIALTGDYLNLSSVRDPQAQAEARDWLRQLCERAEGPIYAITGSPPVDLVNVVPEIFAGLPITWLMDETTSLHASGHHIRLAGLSCTRERDRDAPRLQYLLAGNPGAHGNQFTLLLYHSPDLMPEAVDLGVDLYLCGHTHGGQIRLPFLGAIITSSDFWKRYEMGRYEEGNTILYVSRGLGMEGLGAPRARFLAPPEIVLWTLSGS